MKKIFQISLIVASVFALASCNKVYEDITSDKGFKGALVRNQAGSISYFSEVDNSITADIYSTVNGVDLGGPLTAFSMSSQKGFLLKGANNDQKIETLNSETLISEGVQGSFSNLTDLVAVSDTFVVVTQGVSGSENSGSLMFLDINNVGATLKTLSVGKNPTRLAYSRGKKLYVANTGGGAYPDSTVMVIDIDLKTVIDTVDLKLKKPIDMVLDSYQNIWVLCAGEGVQNAGLAKISYGTHEVTVFPFDNEGYIGKGRGGLSASKFGGTVYFVNDGLYSMQFDDTNFEKFFTGDAYANTIFDAIGVNPYNGRLFCAMDGENNTDGTLSIFSSDGLSINDDAKISVGKMPRQFVFVR